MEIKLNAQNAGKHTVNEFRFMRKRSKAHENTIFGNFKRVVIEFEKISQPETFEDSKLAVYSNESRIDYVSSQVHDGWEWKKCPVACLEAYLMNYSVCGNFLRIFFKSAKQTNNNCEFSVL